jgi:hypothetical protein
MGFFATIYLWFLHHQSAPFALIWTTITAVAGMGMALAVREGAAPTSRKGTTPQNLIPRRHIRAPITRYKNRTRRVEDWAPRASVWFRSFRFNFPSGTILGLLALFLISYIAIILAWEDFAYHDDEMFIFGPLQGHNIALPIWPTEGRFFPLAFQDFNLIRHFTNSITGYHILAIAQLLVFCWIILLILDNEPISAKARVSLLILVVLSQSILTSFSGLIYPEHSLLFFVACFAVSVKRFELTLSTAWAIAAVVCAQFMLYLKEPAFVLLFAFAASRLILRSGMGAGWGLDQLFVRESRLDWNIVCLSALFLVVYFGFVGHHGQIHYDVERLQPLANVLFAYTRFDLLPWLLVTTLMGRVYIILYRRSAPVLLWDGLAFGAVAYFSAYICLGLINNYYLAPVDLIAILYIGRITVLSWSQMGRGEKAALSMLGSIVLLQDVVGSCLSIVDRKNTIHANAEIASAVKVQYERGFGDNLRLFFPFANGYYIMEFAAYLSYRGVPIDKAGDDAPVFLKKVRLAESKNTSAVFLEERTDKDGPCINYNPIKCEFIDEPAPGDLVLVLPTDTASRSAVSVYRVKGELLLFSKPLLPVPSWLHSLFEYWAGREFPDRWLDGSVTKWTQS